jgi:DNA-binding MarR family transcriptional regulator
MVKQLDDSSSPDSGLLPDHVGVDLWRAANAWRQQLRAAMVALGHVWYGDARITIVEHLDPAGMSQAELVVRVGLTKQAVQQLLDALESEGVVRREPDPNDGRGKRVVYTKKGLAALRDGVSVKRTIEADYRNKLGATRYQTLVKALRLLVEE